MYDKTIRRLTATLTAKQSEALKALAARVAGEALPVMHHLTMWGLKSRGLVSRDTGEITDAGRAALALLAGKA